MLLFLKYGVGKMNDLFEALEIYTNRTLIQGIDVVTQNDSNGQGDYIKLWNILDIPQPTMEQIQGWYSSNNISDKLNNKIIQSQLDQIDQQSLSTRYQREFALQNPSLVHSTALAKIQDYENQAINLRKQIMS